MGTMLSMQTNGLGECSMQNQKPLNQRGCGIGFVHMLSLQTS
jgi:hypothetical protein